MNLTPPLVYINSLDNKEVICLLNSLTKYYSQTGIVYHAELYVSNNVWVPVKEDGVTLGRKREDIQINLDGLVKINVKDKCICFTYDDGEVMEFPVTKDFFYYMEYEDDLL